MLSNFVYVKNNLAAEWLRLWSVRSSWFFGICTVLGVLGVSLLAGNEIADSAPAGESPWKVASLIAFPALFGCLILFSIAATADYTTKSIIPTLQWTPQRKLLLATRTLLMVLTATLFGALLAAVSSTVLWFFAPQLTLFSQSDVQKLGIIALVYATSILLTVGVGFLSRNTAATLASVFGLILVLPLLLQVLPFDWVDTVINLLPGTGVVHFLLGGNPGDSVVTDTHAATTLLIWSVGVFILGAGRFLYDDANR